MRFSDSEPTPEEPTPQSLEHTPKTIIQFPQLEVDLDQPSRYDSEALSFITTVEGSKQVAEVTTPNGLTYLLIHMRAPDMNPFVMILDAAELDDDDDDVTDEMGPPDTFLARPTLVLGESIDLSDEGDDGHCVVTFTKQGKLLVYAHTVNTDYLIYTRAKDQDRLPNTSILYDYSSDDPEF